MAEAVTDHPNIRTIGKTILIIVVFFIGGIIAAIMALFIAVIAMTVYILFKGGNVQQVQDMGTSIIHSIWFNVPAVILQDFFAIVIVLLFIRFIDKKKSPLKELRLRPVKGALKSFSKGSMLILVTTIGIVACLLIAGLNTFESTGFSKFSAIAVFASFIGILITCLFIAFGEEILFRGYIQRLLIDRYTVTTGLICATAIFTILHLSNDFRLAPIISVFIGGLIMGYLAIKTDSLYTSIGVHFMWDFLIMDIFQTGKPIIEIGSYPLFLFSTPPDIIVAGINIGRGDECIQTLMVAIMLLAIYVYYHNRQPKSAYKNLEQQAISH